MNNLSDLVGGADLLSNTSYSLVADRFNNPDSAVYLSLSYLLVPPGVYFWGDFTVIAWIQLKSYRSESGIIDFFSVKNKDRVFFSMYLLTSQMYGGVSSNIFPGGSIHLNQWYHVALVCVGGSGYVYANGIQIATGWVFEPSNVSRSNNFVGKDSDAIYDDLKIYFGAMSAANILNDYTMSSYGISF